MAIVFSLDNDAGGLFQIDAATGVISRKGTLTAGTAYAVSVRATDTATGLYSGFTDTITAGANVLAVTGSPKPAYVGTAYSFVPAAQYASGTVTWGIGSGSIPDGMSFSTATGALSGTPTTVGTYSFTITATDSTGTASLAVSIGVTATAPPPANSYNWNPNQQFPSTKAAKASNKRVLAIFLGDSTTAGVTGSTTDYVQHSAPFYCAANLSNGSFDNWCAEHNNSTTEGQTINSDFRVQVSGGTSGSYTGTWTSAEACGGKVARISGTDGKITFTPGKTFDRVRPIVIATGGGTFDLAFNGVRSGNTYSSNNSGNMQAIELTVARQAAGTKVDIVWLGGTLYVQSCEFYDSQSPRVDCVNCGRGGLDTGPLTSGITGWNYVSGSVAFAAQLAFVNFGINDGNYSGTSNADYKSRIDTYVAKLLAAGMDVILVVPTPCKEDSTMETRWAGYRDQLYAIADARNLPVLNLHDRYVSWSTQHAKNPSWMNDALHPQELLYADLGAFYASVIASI